MDDEVKQNQAVGLIDIFKWFWREVPYMPGYKAVHAALFFAILDSINSNFWAENTPIAYDRLINKLRICKQVYLDSRTWLVTNGLIEVIAGQNAYHMAAFNVGLVVRNQTAILTGMLTTIQTAELTAMPTAMLTQVKTIRHKDYKTTRLQDNTAASPVSKIEIPFAENFKKEWADWKDYKRKEHRFNYKSSQTEQAALNDLLKISGNNEEKAISIIQQSIANGWKGFFELKNTANGHTINNNQKNGSSGKGSGRANLGAEFAAEISQLLQ